MKYSLEENVKQNFLEPLSHLQSKDLKEVNVSIVRLYVIICVLGKSEYKRIGSGEKVGSIIHLVIKFC